ncbi:hypothetical protein [Cytobacillus sp.]|uniref:DUF7668 domain-containing protein n=1 Tax=Cytobacillus sp. TaxID=2675269 RepID=UPI0028BDE0F0|nr:hypothetical protein [Cytobacillus sp.]
MPIEEQIRQLAKEAFFDLVHLRYDKLKKENKLTEETENFLKEVFQEQGILSLPPSNEEMDIDVYEYNDNSGYCAEIRYLWFDDEESPIVLFCQAKANEEKTRVTEFYIETLDA